MSERKARSRFEWVPGQHEPKPVRIGLIALAVSALVLYVGFTASIPFLPEKGTEVTAVFEHATNAKPGTHVRVDGVRVGSVVKVAPAARGRGAAVTMRLDEDSGVELKRDARAAVWWRTLLGRNMYVELDPGSPSAPALGSATIPVTRTTAQVEFDDLLGVLDPTGRKSVQTMLREFDRGFAAPDAVGASIDALSPMMRSSAPALRAMGGTQPGDLSRLVTQTSRALGALARDEVALGGLIDGANVTLGVTAARRADLGATLERAPASLRQTRASMIRLRTTLDALDPLAASLRPGVRRLSPAVQRARPMLASLDRLLARAEPLLLDLRPTAQGLTELAPDARALVRDAGPAVTRAKDEVLPLLYKRSPDTKWRTFEGVGPTFSAIASAAQQYDIFGHVMRFQAGASEQFVGPAPCSTVFLDPTAKEKVNCELLEQTVQSLFGLPPASVQQKVTRAMRAGADKEPGR